MKRDEPTLNSTDLLDIWSILSTMILWSCKNLRNAILRATSIAVDPLSEKNVRDAQPVQVNQMK